MQGLPSWARSNIATAAPTAAANTPGRPYNAKSKQKSAPSRLRLVADSYNVKSWARGYCILMILFMIALYLVESMYYMIGSYRFRDAHVGVWHMVFIAGQWIMGTIFLVPALVVSRWYNLWDKRLYNSRRDVAEIFGSLIIIVPVLTAIQVIDLARFGIIQDLDLHSAALPVYRSTCFLGGTCSLVLLYVLFRCVPAFWRKAPQMAVYVVQND